MDFLAISGCKTHFSKMNCAKTDKLHIKFSALSVDFEGPSLDFLGSKKSASDGIK